MIRGATKEPEGPGEHAAQGSWEETVTEEANAIGRRTRQGEQRALRVWQREGRSSLTELTIQSVQVTVLYNLSSNMKSNPI